DNRYIATIPGRGYRFVAPVMRQQPSQSLDQQSVLAEAARNRLPVVAGIGGRAEIISLLFVPPPQRGCVNRVGPGGIGKTTLAAAVAHASVPNYRDGSLL